jgi:hypothetical protein
VSAIGGDVFLGLSGGLPPSVCPAAGAEGPLLATTESPNLAQKAPPPAALPLEALGAGRAGGAGAARAGLGAGKERPV